MKYRVEITPSAEADIEAAYNFIRKDSPPNAAKWRQGLYDVAETLSRISEGCSLALESRELDFVVRQKFYGRYRILFTVEGNRVVVLNVRHGSRRVMPAGEIQPPDLTL